MFREYIKVTAIMALASFAIIGCSAKHDFNPNKPHPELSREELRSCPPGIDPDEGPRWLCNPEDVVSNRFPQVFVASAHFPNASQHLNKSVAIARARVEIAKMLGLLTGNQLKDFENAQNGNGKTLLGLQEKLPGQLLRNTRMLSSYYDNDGRVHVLVVHDTYKLDEYEPVLSEDPQTARSGVTDQDLAEFEKTFN